MCFGSRPSPPPAPAPEPVDSPIEDTADAVVVGTQKTKKKKADSQVAMGKRMGTKSLQIPLAGGSSSGNLNYPT
tara:strand:- start:181 stop:402 length:222 start_codon:yes stop_codon:yes gene_type:complete